MTGLEAGPARGATPHNRPRGRSSGERGTSGSWPVKDGSGGVQESHRPQADGAEAEQKGKDVQVRGIQDCSSG